MTQQTHLQMSNRDNIQAAPLLHSGFFDHQVKTMATTISSQEGSLSLFIIRVKYQILLKLIENRNTALDDF